VTVALVNPGGAMQTVSIPLTYDTVVEMEIGPGETVNLGAFAQPDNELNAGFRDLAPFIDMVVDFTPDQMTLTFGALIGLTYEVQVATDLKTQNWEPLERMTATSRMAMVETATASLPASGAALFRVNWLRDQD
jgi:hypothetical protein